MTGQQLRNSILQEAIHGRLVPNVLQAGEKTGAELLQSVIGRFPKNGQKGKTEISAEDGPWELPECWCWCKYNDLFEVSGGSQPPKSYFIESPRDGYVRLYQIRDYGPNPIPIYVPKTMVSKFTKKGDILIARYGGSLGKIFWAEDGAYNVAMAKSIPRWEGISLTKYQYYFYHTQLFRDAIFGASSRSAQAGFNKEDLESLLFPLPPLSIQKAIVEKIEELLPLIDEYDKAAIELETLNKILPDKLRKSVLQEAIHGNLVPNDIPEGEATASELLQQIIKERQDRENKEKGKKAKKLALSTIEEEPWELPEGWCWCRGKDIFFPMESTKPKADFVYIDTDAVNNKKNIIDNPKSVLLKNAPSRATRKLHANDILFSMVRPYLKNIAYVDEQYASAIGTTGFYVITTSSSLYQPYLFKLMLSDYVVSGLTEYMKGDNSPSINNGHIEDFLYPLPPLSIQKAIVKKIEELFATIDKLQS